MLTWTSRSSSSPEGRTVAFPPLPRTRAPSRLHDTRGSGTPLAAQGSSTSSPSRTASSTGPAMMMGGTGWDRRAGTCSYLDSNALLGGAGEGTEQRMGLVLSPYPALPCTISLVLPTAVPEGL